MSRICKWILRAWLVLYLAALGLLAIGTFGLFGNERDPLAAVFLVPLGLPWNLLLGSFPDPLRMGLALGAPVLNLLVLWFACRALGARRTPGGSS